MCPLKPGARFDVNFRLKVFFCLIHHYQSNKTVLWHLFLLTCIKVAEPRDDSVLIILLRLENRHKSEYPFETVQTQRHQFFAREKVNGKHQHATAQRTKLKVFLCSGNNENKLNGGVSDSGSRCAAVSTVTATVIINSCTLPCQTYHMSTSARA